jgi:tyrosinase
MAIRKDQATLSATEKKQFVDAVLALKAEQIEGNTNTYDWYVRAHLNTDHGQDPAGRPLNDAHYGPAFFPWHRQFLIEFERDLQRVSGDQNLGLPYWDWSVDNSQTSSIWGSDFMGGNGRASDGKVMDGQFAYDKRNDDDPRKWVLKVRTSVEELYLRRQFGSLRQPPFSLPTPSDVRDARNETPYDVQPWDDRSTGRFRNRAEGWIPYGMHNLVHNWVGGSMLPITSPNDPIFFLHHCFVDKLWADWQVLHGIETPYLPPSGARLGHNLNDTMRPWTVSPAAVLDNWGQGYTYDVALRGSVHIQERGDWPLRQNVFAGTRGQALRLEGFQLNFDPPIPGLGMEYMGHIQEQGDTPWYPGGQFVGTKGQARRLEGFAIRLTGSNANYYSVSYMAHIQEQGDTAWYQDGAFCGTRGQARRVEGILVSVDLLEAPPISG